MNRISVTLASVVAEGRKKGRRGADRREKQSERERILVRGREKQKLRIRDKK